MTEQLEQHEVAAIFGAYRHRGAKDWRCSGEHWIYSPTAGMGLNLIEARPIAEYYLVSEPAT